MLDFRILTRFGTTNARLKSILTAKPFPEGQEVSDDERKDRDKDIATRKRIEDTIRNRLYEHIQWGLTNHRHWSSVDLAMDAAPITKDLIPLMQYAKGRIDVKACASQLSESVAGKKYIKKNEGGQIDIDMPKFFQTEVNMVRSFVQRAVEEQSGRYANAWPYLKYDPRATGDVSRCRADVLSQRVDVMVDQYGYRMHDNQCYRDVLKYAAIFDFVASSWDVERQWQFKDGWDNDALLPADREINSVVVREGINWITPHPSRVFYDNAHPISSLLTDTGCTYVGFWDVRRYGSILNNMAFFNRDSIKFGSTLWELYTHNACYFNQYIDTVKPPVFKTDDPTQNDRRANIGCYSQGDKDSSIYVAEYYQKLIPKEYGIGDYPYPVWVRFVVASDDTVVFAEIMPSTPVAPLTHNWDDNRQLSISFAHEVMPYQDMMSNLFSEMMMAVKRDLLTVLAIDTDVLDAKEVKAIEEGLKGENWFANPVVIKYSRAKVAELQLKPEQVVSVVQSKTSASISNVFGAMANLISVCERMTAMSQNRQGQANPREVSATEVNEISSATASVADYLSMEIDQWRAAKKRIIYDSLVSLGEGDLKVPVVGRYTRKTIEAAGFKVQDADNDGVPDQDMRTDRWNVIGSKSAIIHDYYFTTRDGGERAVNTQMANTLVQLVGFISNVPRVLQALGKEKLFNIINTIFRLSGTGVDLNLELKEGETDEFGGDPMEQVQAVVQKLGDAVNQLMEVTQTNTDELAEQKQVNAAQEEQLKLLNQLAQQVKALSAATVPNAISDLR